MCHLPLSYLTNTIKNSAFSWGSYGWEWSVVGLSVLSHMHTPPVGWPHVGNKKKPPPSLQRTPHSHYYTILSIICSSLRRDGVCSFSRTGIFSVWSHVARRGAISQLAFTFFHIVESGVFSLCISRVWCKNFLTHRLRVCIFLPSVVCVSSSQWFHCLGGIVVFPTFELCCWYVWRLL